MPAITGSFTSDVTEGIIPFTVNFTDTTTGSPDVWLWEFGDGFLSTDQNPTHTYRKAGTYDVKLTVMDKDFTISTGLASDNFNLYGVDSNFIYTDVAAAQTAFRTTLPYTGWSSPPPVDVDPYFSTLFSKGVSLFEYNCGFIERECGIEFYDNSYLSYLTMRFDSISFLNSTKKYDDDVPYALKVGHWGGSDFDGNEVVFDVKHLPTDNSDIPIFNLEPYFGFTNPVLFRLIDGYEWAKLITPFASSSGWRSTSSLYHAPHWQSFRVSNANNKDIVDKSNYITVNENIIQRPPSLYSGVREVYFSDGWENDKHFYIKKTDPSPCSIQYFDLFVDTTNE